MHKPQLLPGRPSFQELWNTLHFQPGLLCMQAQAPVGTVRLMIHGHAVPRADARKVLEKLSEQFQGYYTLETVAVAVKSEPS